jgi:serine/threonine protein kinase, bacterial
MTSASASDFDRGRRIGKYEILTRLSIGGMAELFLAFLTGPGGFKKFVAVKQILPDVKRNEAFVRMFLDEARITAAFSHANIGQVFDLGEDPHSRELYLAMEFIAGQNLEQVLRRAAKKKLEIPVGFAARVIRDTALGLHYAHHFVDPSTGKASPVVHRDVSPKNVMITYTGTVKVIDFGIATARGRLNRTQVGIVKGTSGYMAPEQVKNEQLDGRADLFAAAVLFHEMVCGERLFEAPTSTGMMLKIVEGQAQSPSAMNPFVSEELSNVVLKGLEKSRGRRFSTGKEFARAIEQSCAELFEEEQVAEFMTQLFDDKIALTRSILELANEPEEVSELSRAVEGLTQEEQDTGVDGRKKVVNGTQTRNVGTPASQFGPRKQAGTGRLSRSGPSRKQPSPPIAGTTRRRVPSGELDEATPKPKPRLPDETLPPRSRANLRGPRLDEPSQQDTQTARAGGGGIGRIFATLVVLVVLGGGAWAVSKGPLAALFKDDEPIATDTGPRKLDVDGNQPSGAKPAWVIEKEEDERKLAEEKARQLEIEAAAADPERLALLQEITSQIEQLNRLEEEQRQLKVEARQGKTETAVNSRRIDDLQKQIIDLKEALKEKEELKNSRRTPRGPAGGVDVVRDVKGARANSVGYLSLRTANPSSAAVFLGRMALGSTPLMKTPIEAGVHRLRIVDADSRNRVLSVTIASGRTEELKVNVGNLPLGP